jgi:hypothetical protein
MDQGDPRWGRLPYGRGSNCSPVSEGGCGPTSLAIVLNFLAAEDPEGIATLGTGQIITPVETVPYAEQHGRVCGSGTMPATMVGDLAEHFPSFRGRRVAQDEVVDELRSGNLVIYHGRNFAGRTRTGARAKTYQGHILVLGGVDASGTTFNVLDPGRKDATDVETMSISELGQVMGFYVVERVE